MQVEFLVIAGLLSFLAAVLHIGVIIGGPGWYRFFGAGEDLAQLSEKGSLKPTLITLFIASVLALWGAYAWSGAGLVPKMPLLKWALVAITAVYLIRGVGGLVAPFVSTYPLVKQNSIGFWIWSSVICLIIGAFHLMGTLSKWSAL
ncbi:hypothetical protein [Sedimenticola sp.]|uniref:hypothetical protein n=1 Tax=Sedimenticola sp. TaxID=1940285 RepID=UPI003D0A557E